LKARTELIIAGVGAGAVAVTYAIKRILGEKRFHTMPYGYGIKVKRAITVDRPPEDLYQYWRNLENVAALSGGLLSMKIIDRTRSQWTLQAPGGMELRWTAEIMVDRPNKMIGWRSIGRGDIDNAGYVRFERATGGRGTVMRVALQYNPPAGKLGAMLAAALGKKPESLIEQALRRFKQLMEAGEIPRIESVETASEDSFPASDPPAWTGTTGPRG
jgi:uncharacterized membrane protein